MAGAFRENLIVAKKVIVEQTLQQPDWTHLFSLKFQPELSQNA